MSGEAMIGRLVPYLGTAPPSSSPAEQTGLAPFLNSVRAGPNDTIDKLDCCRRAVVQEHQLSEFPLPSPSMSHFLEFDPSAAGLFVLASRSSTQNGTSSNKTGFGDGSSSKATPSVDYGPQVNFTMWLLTALAAMFLALRLYCKFLRHRGLWWDDHVLIASWVGAPTISIQ